MQIPPFQLERYFARHEFAVPYHLCASDCESLRLGELTAYEPGAAEALGNLWLGYTESQGAPELRAEISRLYERINTAQILVHAGAEEAIFTFMNALLTPGDHVIVHYPAYQSLFEIARATGCEVTPWVTRHEDSWELDPERLRTLLRPSTRAIVINCPHNPTGYQMPRGTFDEIVRLAQHHGITVFSDEVYRGLEYDEGDRLPTLCDVDERGVSLGVLSKTFGLPGLRIGWAASRNTTLLARMAAFKDYTTICSSAPSEFLAALALRHRERIVARNRALISCNLETLNDFFGRHKDTFAWVPPKAGPIAFPMLTNAPVEAFCERLAREAGVLLLPGTLYDSAYNNFRIGFGRANLPDCVARFEQFLTH